MTVLFFFFFNDTATTEIYTLSLHDALPIWLFGYHLHWTGAKVAVEIAEDLLRSAERRRDTAAQVMGHRCLGSGLDRKSTRLNSSHANISYAVFCLKKKKNQYTILDISQTTV